MLPVFGFVASTCADPFLPCEEGCAEGGGGGSGGDFTLGAPVEIVRDQDGVVHLYGKTDTDVFYASGYMQATDRLYQMDLMRRQVYGRRAEVLGEWASGDDALIRQLDVARWGREGARVAKQESSGEYALIEAWTAGVNARIDEVLAGEAEMPLGFTVLGFEPERWEPEDAFVVGKTIVFNNGNQLEFDLLATFIREFKPDLFTTLPFYTPLVPEFIAPASGPSPLPAPSPSPEHAREPRSWPADTLEKIRAMQDRLRSIRPGASNNWAVGPELTDNGRSLIAGDPHQQLRSPSLMWLHHMHSEENDGRLDVAGWTFVGTPGISLGHNRSLAWTATTTYADVTDVWDVEVIDGEAIIAGEAVPIEAREESIAVKDGDPVTITVEVVPGYGVLLPSDLAPLPIVDVGHRLLFNWTGYRATHEPQAFFAMGTSTSLDEFDSAVDQMELGSFNFIAATTDETTFRSSPIVPDRGDPSEAPAAYAMMDASDPASLWTGALLPMEKMPHSRGAADGVLLSANNDPLGFTGDGSLTNDPYYFGAYFDPGTRAGRIRARLDELAAEGPISIEDMQALQMDVHSLLADEVLGILDDAWASLETDESLAEFRDRPELAALVTLLSGWDRSMSRDAAAPVAFEALLSFFSRAVIGDDMGIFFEPVADNSPTYAIKFALLAARDEEQTLLQEGKRYLVLSALSETAALLQARYGAVDAGFTWADYHVTSFPSQSIAELDGGSQQTDGAEGTINVSEARFFSGGEPNEYHVSSAGAIYRMTASFDDDGVPRAFFTMARGASEDPASPHFSDLTDAWVRGEPRLLRFKREDVDAGAAETFTLEP
ncbi:MAG: penicillin acylase family protein [Polyangiaceae bacterium]|nr:penicillin acylase family protein [Polyangiaceae bacterium]